MRKGWLSRTDRNRENTTLQNVGYQEGPQSKIRQ